jgi:hypothetical protein
MADDTKKLAVSGAAATNGDRTEKQETGMFDEIGATGLKRSGGKIHEEFLTELQGDRGIRVIAEMRDNEPIIGALLFAIEMVIRNVDWASIPGGTSPQDAEAADFLGSIPHDLNVSWPEFIAEMLSFLPFGWAYHEIVWKRRDGEQPTGSDVPSSNYDDGRTGVRKLAIRAQETLEDWHFDESGGIRGLSQRPPPDFDVRDIPIEKALLFRTTASKGNPEGRSILRNAYRPWYFKRTIEETEAIGIERELAGFPVAGVPARLFKQSASDAEKQALDEWTRTVRDIRNDSLQGLVKPNEYDENGNNQYTLELLATGGQRAIDTVPVIQRKNVEMASTVLADFILLGHEKVGSFALASQKSDLFSVAVNGWLTAAADVLNRHLVPRLFRVNDFRIDTYPILQPTQLERVDLKELGEYVVDLAGVGYDLFPNRGLESALLQAANLPEPTDDEREEREAANEMFEEPTEGELE